MLSLVIDIRLFCSAIERLCPGGRGRFEKIPKSNFGNGSLSDEVRFSTGAGSDKGLKTIFSKVSKLSALVVGFIAGLGSTLDGGVDSEPCLLLEVVLDPLLDIVLVRGREKDLGVGGATFIVSEVIPLGLVEPI